MNDTSKAVAVKSVVSVRLINYLSVNIYGDLENMQSHIGVAFHLQVPPSENGSKSLQLPFCSALNALVENQLKLSNSTYKLEVHSHLTWQQKSAHRSCHPREYENYTQGKCGEIRLKNRNFTVPGVLFDSSLKL
jgi:hypothetical protein